MGGSRGAHEAKGAQGVIKRDQLSFCIHSGYLTNKLTLVCSIP